MAYATTAAGPTTLHYFIKREASRFAVPLLAGLRYYFLDEPEINVHFFALFAFRAFAAF